MPATRCHATSAGAIFYMRYKYKRILLTWSPGRILISRIRKIRFDKHEGVSLYSIINTFLRNLQKDQILDRANGVAFNFTLAIFPGIIFLFTLTPYISEIVPTINRQSILENVAQMLPPNMSMVVSSTIEDIVNNARGGLLTFGFLFSLYLATNGMMALMRAFNACYRTVEKRGGLKTRLIATALTLSLAFVLMLSIVLLVIGGIVMDYITSHLSEFEFLHLSDHTVQLIFVLRFVVIFISFYLAIATIYYFGPAIHWNWRFFSVGSWIATLLCLGVSYGFSFYVTNYGNYNKLYGSIGVLIALMIWIQLFTIVLMVGYEINASIHKAIHMKALANSKRKWKS